MNGCGVHKKSPPSRWSGLKYSVRPSSCYLSEVSTLAVEWIEIASTYRRHKIKVVSTLAVEWIEIQVSVSRAYGLKSPPSRWSGLKSYMNSTLIYGEPVSTLAVEWIEIHV